MESKKPMRSQNNVVNSRNNSVSVRTGNPASKSAVPVGTADKAAVRKAAAGHAVRAPRMVTRKDTEKKPFPFAIVLTAIAITVLFMFMMMNYAEIDKYNSGITETQNKISSLKKEVAKLEVKQNDRQDLTAFEEFATEELGMVKSDSLKSYIINLNPEDKTGIIEYDDGEEEGFGYILFGLGEVIRDFVG